MLSKLSRQCLDLSLRLGNTTAKQRHEDMESHFVEQYVTLYWYISSIPDDKDLESTFPYQFDPTGHSPESQRWTDHIRWLNRIIRNRQLRSTIHA